ncbi:MAG: hypothetical protein KAJ53_01120 [Anaerolineales bacterium]|nr:hypothetical protein [Anaerolineales bacterium]
MKILLLDMDGVLIKPLGYHKALQETVRLIAGSLGFADTKMTSKDILAFESAGVSSEWDSAAICAALLLEKAWDYKKTQQYPISLTEPPKNNIDYASPDFQTFAARMNQADLSEFRPLKRAERLLTEQSNHHNSNQKRQLRAILRNARGADGSLTHNTFQELVLGSQTYTRIFDHPTALNTNSYLLRYDRPNLSSHTRAFLNKWLKVPYHQAIIFTSRPSKPISGTFSTPEAELGAEQVGLENLPILGLGGLAWLSERLERSYQAFLKPSPVHVLSALQLALGASLENALTKAAKLVEGGQFDSSWKGLNGAQVWVFEDTSGGLQSAIAAQTILREHGIVINISLNGIANDRAKVQALQEVGAKTKPNLNAALRQILLPQS